MAPFLYILLIKEEGTQNETIRKSSARLRSKKKYIITSAQRQGSDICWERSRPRSLSADWRDNEKIMEFIMELNHGRLQEKILEKGDAVA